MSAHVINLNFEICKLSLKVGVVVSAGMKNVTELDVFFIALLESKIEIIDSICEALSLSGADVKLFEDRGSLVLKILEVMFRIHKHSVVVFNVGVSNFNIIDLIVTHLEDTVKHVNF